MQSIVLTGSSLRGGFSVAERERKAMMLPLQTRQRGEKGENAKEEEGRLEALKKGSMKDA